MSMERVGLEGLDALCEEARQAIAFAHSPYSKFRIGAAILTSTGKIFRGANVESAFDGLTMCAERVAVYQAVSQGERTIAAMAVECGAPLGSCAPCAVCSQVLREFAEPDVKIVYTIGGVHVLKRLSELLPETFGHRCAQ